MKTWASEAGLAPDRTHFLTRRGRVRDEVLSEAARLTTGMDLEY